jgi:hypothetical protein
MFRDRLRQWGMNDKNHRGNIDRRRKVTQSADNRDKITAQQDSCQPTASLKPTQPIMSVHQNLSSVLCTPKEMRMLHRALKGVLDWQKEFEDSTYTRDGNPIGQMLTDIQEALRWNYQKPLTCTKVSRQLQKTGAALQRRMKEPCGLLDIHQSVGALLQRVGPLDFHFSLQDGCGGSLYLPSIAVAIPSTPQRAYTSTSSHDI